MARHIAILACGPSLSMYAPKPDYDIVIGVNRAVERYDCHWWCFRNWRMYRQVQPRRHMLIFMPQTAQQQMQRADRLAAARLDREVVLHHEAVEFPMARMTGSGLLRWNAFSGLAALGLAWHLDAARIDVFGADLFGQTDFSQRPNLLYTNDRWNRQRLLWEQMTTIFEQSGRRLQRILTPCRQIARNRLADTEPSHG